MKTLQEMTIAELEDLLSLTFGRYRDVRHEVQIAEEGDPRLPALCESREAIRLHYLRVDDELNRRGA